MWAAIGNFFLNFIWNKIAALLVSAWNKATRRKQIDKEAEESVDPLKKAKTGKEIDDATDDALGGL